MDPIEYLEREQIRTDLPDFSPGDTIKVHVRIKEGDKERIQVFEGIVIRKKKGGASASFTVRKNSYGIDVERTFPLNSPVIEKVVIVNKGSVRRARLYYLRRLQGKASRIKEKKATQQTGSN